MFFDTFSVLCSKKGVTPNKACIDIGISRTAVAKWKSGGVPNGTTLAKMSEYFNVTTDYLLGKEKAPAKEADADEMAVLLQEFRDNPDLKVLFSLSKKATPEELRQYVDVIKALRGSRE